MENSKSPKFSGSTLVDLLQFQAIQNNNKIACRFMTVDNNGEEQIQTLSYKELDINSRKIAALLQNKQFKAGERAILIYQPGLDLISAFFGAIYAGLLPILVYPPHNPKLVHKLQNIIQNSNPSVLLSTEVILKKLKSLRRLKWINGVPLVNYLTNKLIPYNVQLTNWNLDQLKWIATDTIPITFETKWSKPDIQGDMLAFLQYTSGSTGVPKGVMISHKNIIHNLEKINHAFCVKNDDVFVSWLPPFHDMGLIGGILTPIYGGIETDLMSPITFLKHPAKWLTTISNRKQRVLSGGPNFSYDYCVKKIPLEVRKKLDLSNWFAAWSGAEPIRYETIESFVSAFKPHGFTENALCPSYGLAESTLLVTSHSPGSKPKIIEVSRDCLKQDSSIKFNSAKGKTKKLISCGLPVDDLVIISNSTNLPCPPNVIGEICFSSQSVSKGYWNYTKSNDKEFFSSYRGVNNDKLYLKTGDLGFLSEDGELFVTGRIKDLIIVNGANHYSHDIEHTVSTAHPLIRANQCACFAFDHNNNERLVIVCETNAQDIKNEGPQIIDAIKHRVKIEHELPVFWIALINPKSLPKTTSGKLKRFETKELLISKKLEIMHEWKENEY